jgi:superfamily I DNA/RNA helicase
LGWRIILESEKGSAEAECVRAAAAKNCSLEEVVPEDLKERVAKEAANYEAKEKKEKDTEKQVSVKIKRTSFEGAKGLSAQHVFIVGLHDGDLPRDRHNIQDLEVCRFIVGLTRTKKQCSILISKRFANEWKKPSPFIFWIKRERYEEILVDAEYWKKTVN